MSFPRYPKYKESEVESLGLVPEHWVVSTLTRHTLARCDGPFGSGLKSEHYVDGGVRVIRLQNIKTDGFDASNEAFIDEEYFLRELAGHDVRQGDLLIAGLGDENNTVGRACVAPKGIEPALVKADCFRFRLDTKRLLPEFAALYLTSRSSVDAGLLSSGSTRSRIPLSVMGARRVVVPPLSEQKVIAAFLDRETAKIDALVAKQRRLIELLKEKRQAVISHAVTKGLNPHAPMKDSGIEWLGEVPTHWRVSKMKWVAKMESGHTPDKKVPEYWEDGDIPWVSLNDTGFLRDNDYISDTAYSTTLLGIENSSARVLPPGTVVFSRDATIGRCAITTRPMAVSQHFIAWVCGAEVLPEYLLLRFRSMTQELDRLTTGATLRTIGMPDVRTLVTPVPPVSEQRAIVDWVSFSTGSLDALTTAAEQAVDLLQERRAALISAAVTGQIDVSNLAERQAAA